MTVTLSTAERLLYNAVRLTTYRGPGALQNGTGFFYRFPLAPGVESMLIITNKHVLDQADRIEFVLHLGDPSSNGKPNGSLFTVNHALANSVVYHPDADVDLCGILISEVIGNMRAGGNEPFIVCVEPEVITTAEDEENFDGIEDILMIGCPSGIYDRINNLPIARRGITATPLAKNYNGKQEFMIDVACFPGSSGSPIFVHNPNGFLDRKQNAFQFGLPRLKLVGILYAGPQFNNRGELVLSHPGDINVRTMMHLGNALKAALIFDLQRIVQSLWDKTAA